MKNEQKLEGVQITIWVEHRMGVLNEYSNSVENEEWAKTWRSVKMSESELEWNIEWVSFRAKTLGIANWFSIVICI